jgi:hypothetical protein
MQVSIQRMGMAAARLTLAALVAVLALFGAQAHAKSMPLKRVPTDLVVKKEALVQGLIIGSESVLSDEASWSRASSIRGYIDSLFGTLVGAPIGAGGITFRVTLADFDREVLAKDAHPLTFKGTWPVAPRHDGYVAASCVSSVAEPGSLALLCTSAALAAVARRKYSATGTSSALR